MCLPALLLSFRYACKCGFCSVSVALGLVTAWSSISEDTSMVMRSPSERQRQRFTFVLLNPTCICGGGKLIPHTNTSQTPEHVASNSFRREFKSALICSLLAAHNPIISPRAPHLRLNARLCHGLCSAQYDMGYPGCSPNPRLLPKSQAGPVGEGRACFSAEAAFTPGSAAQFAPGNPGRVARADRAGHELTMPRP